MSRQTVQILNGQGHLSLDWDTDNPEEVAAARVEVERLKAAGYQFFRADQAPADEITAGAGHLSVVRIEDPLLLPPTDPVGDPDVPVARRRGRPAVGAPAPGTTVAMQPQRGG